MTPLPVRAGSSRPIADAPTALYSGPHDGLLREWRRLAGGPAGATGTVAGDCGRPGCTDARRERDNRRRLGDIVRAVGRDDCAESGRVAVDRAPADQRRR